MFLRGNISFVLQLDQRPFLYIPGIGFPYILSSPWTWVVSLVVVSPWATPATESNHAHQKGSKNEYFGDVLPPFHKTLISLHFSVQLFWSVFEVITSEATNSKIASLLLHTKCLTAVILQFYFSNATWVAICQGELLCCILCATTRRQIVKILTLWGPSAQNGPPNPNFITDMILDG